METKKKVLEAARQAMEKPEGPEREAAVKEALRKANRICRTDLGQIRLELARVLVLGEEAPIRTFNRMLQEQAKTNNLPNFRLPRL
jgi:hypothetical protein